MSVNEKPLPALDEAVNEFIKARLERNKWLYGEYPNGSYLDGEEDMKRAYAFGLARRDKEIERLRTTLQFYADRDNWLDREVTQSCGCCSIYEESRTLEDYGRKARQALEHKEKKDE